MNFYVHFYSLYIVSTEIATPYTAALMVSNSATFAKHAPLVSCGEFCAD